MPITDQEAWDATDPSQTTEQRELSAKQILAGVAANDAYYQSRPELERLVALSQGGQIVSHDELNDSSEDLPTGGDIKTVDGTAVEEPPIGLKESNDGDTDSEVVADKLRQQIKDAGMEPAA